MIPNNLIHITIFRDKFNKDNTLGKMYINGSFFCYTLEDAFRGVKIKHEACIPEGSYRVELTRSNRFKRILPILIGVEGYEGVRIHRGNTEGDTSGCPLVGFNRSEDRVFNQAESKLMDFLTDKKNILITITNL